MPGWRTANSAVPAAQALTHYLPGLPWACPRDCRHPSDAPIPSPRLAMKVAVLSYPTLFQTVGGLRMKVGRTVDALNRRGIQAELLDPVRQKLADFDLVHVFAPYNGNHRIVEQAKSDGVPVVMSTILNIPMSYWAGHRARLISRAVGRLSHWDLTTDFAQIAAAMRDADHLIALGKTEQRSLIEGYGIPANKVSIVRNGVGEEFFRATPAAFLSKYRVPQPFVLHTGMIGSVKNQIGLIRALKNETVNIVLIGYCAKSEQPQLDACLAEGGARVHYLNELPHGELIASAYAAAAVVAIPSRHEGMPNSILEGLAADKPVVLTNKHSMDIDLPTDAAIQVGPDDHAGIHRAVMGFLRQPPPPGRARSVVSALSWAAVADELAAIYRKVKA